MATSKKVAVQGFFIVALLAVLGFVFLGFGIYEIVRGKLPTQTQDRYQQEVGVMFIYAFVTLIIPVFMGVTLYNARASRQKPEPECPY